LAGVIDLIGGMFESLRPKRWGKKLPEYCLNSQNEQEH
jgi:hypothetical protein